MTQNHASRALILGGGGTSEMAWEWGIRLGLHERGIAVTDVGLVVGTSAGAGRRTSHQWPQPTGTVRAPAPAVGLLQRTTGAIRCHCTGSGETTTGSPTSDKTEEICTWDEEQNHSSSITFERSLHQ